MNPWLDYLDEVDEGGLPAPTTDPGEALDLVEAAAAAAAQSATAPDAVLLSGGVDSMLTALAAARAGHHPICVTAYVMGPDPAGPDAPSSELAAARRCAQVAGLEWVGVPIPFDSLGQRVRSAMDEGGGRGLFHVAADVINLACADVLEEHDCRVVWTGSGADDLFGPRGNLDDPDGPDHYDFAYRARSIRHVARVMPGTVPVLVARGYTALDFYETRGFIEASARIAPTLLVESSGPEPRLAKLPLRDLAVRWGLDPELARRPKAALQRSTGLFDALAEFARRDSLWAFGDVTSHPPRLHGRDTEIMTGYWLLTFAGASVIRDPEPF